MFFSPRGEYEACGMFTLPHILLLLFCLILVGVALYFAIKLNEKHLDKFTKIYAIVIVLLEIIKIGYNHYYHHFDLDAWVPLSYCSLFMYALVFTAFGKGKLKEIGKSFLVCGSIFAGLAFIIYPSTCLTEVPIFHFLTFHSFTYHSSMFFIGLLYFIKSDNPISKKNFINYALFCLAFAIPAYIINILVENSNLMFLYYPYALPFPFLNPLSEKCRIVYALIIEAGYILGSFSGVSLLKLAIKHKK